MTRFAFLVMAVLLFTSTPWILARMQRASPRWRVSLAFLSVVGLAAGWISLLAAILLPEVLVAPSIGQLWQTCSRAFQAIWSEPLGRLPSIVAGVALAIIVGRLAWALVLGARTTRGARIRGGNPQLRLAGGAPVHVLPLDHPEAYSLGGLRPQVVVSRGLVEALDDDERSAVLLHEEGHLKSRHHGILLLSRALQSALRPLPSVTLAVAVLEQAMEERADEYAASRLGSPAVVASGLSKAALVRIRRPVGALSFGDGPDVPARVRRLLTPQRTPAWASFACAVVAVSLLVTLGLTQAIAGLAVVAAAHHLLGIGMASVCPLKL